MNVKTLKILEYEKIKEELKKYTVSDLGKKLVNKLEPSTNLIQVKNRLMETTEAKAVLNRSSHLPLQGIHDIKEQLDKVEKGGILNPGELIRITDFLRGCRKMKKFMKSQQQIAPILGGYSFSITEFKPIEDEINTCIDGGRVSDKASHSLEKVRKRIDMLENKIEQKLRSILTSSKYKNYIQDFFISKKNDKFVIPIKSSYQKFIEGNMITKSATGSTVFIEPASVSKLSMELTSLKCDEEAEVYQVLATLTGIIAIHLRAMNINVEAIAVYDFAFAKGKYSNCLDGIEPRVNNCDFIRIVKGRHPLLGGSAVPLDFEIGKDYRTLVITGPNTGGKTVTLKTIGILSLMAQSGLHISAGDETEICVFKRIFTDIGDSQSIEQSLSTFSGHIKNIIDIMRHASNSTLVLIDEIGTGTDPTEGAMLAAAILEDLYLSHSITVVTTHYGEIKDYSSQHKGFKNGSMAFESETLKPLYRLIIGKPGKSNALWISQNLGMKDNVLKRASLYIQNRTNKAKTVDFEIQNNTLIVPKKKTKEHEEIKGKTIDNHHSDLNKGDNVILLDFNTRGIVYEPEDEFGNLVIFVDDELKKINIKRVKLFLKRDKLYPSGYDLDTIFVSYKKRKLERDLERGSVKNTSEFRERISELRDEYDE